MADHARAAPDPAFGDRPAGGCGECGLDVLEPDVEAVDVAQLPVVRLADDRQAPGRMIGVALPRPDLDEGVADHPERARVGDGQGAMEEARFPDPLEAAHVAVAVEDVSAGEDRLGPGVAVVGHDHRHAGPDRALAADERTLASDDRGVTDADTGDVGDRVEAPGPALTDDDPQISCPYPVRVAHSGSNPWPPRTPARLAEARLGRRARARR